LGIENMAHPGGLRRARKACQCTPLGANQHGPCYHAPPPVVSNSGQYEVQRNSADPCGPAPHRRAPECVRSAATAVLTAPQNFPQRLAHFESPIVVYESLLPETIHELVVDVTSGVGCAWESRGLEAKKPSPVPLDLRESRAPPAASLDLRGLRGGLVARRVHRPAKQSAV
jgi:hypothetical protein